MIYNGVNCHVFFVVENRGWQECKDVAEERKRIAVISFIKITIGTFLYAAGISLFLDPNSLAPGGAVGISIILNRLTGIGTGNWRIGENEAGKTKDWTDVRRIQWGVDRDFITVRRNRGSKSYF